MKKLQREQDGLGKPVIIILIVVGVIAVGVFGYFAGKNKAEADAKEYYNGQIQSLQQDLDEARAVATPKVEEGQQSVEALQAENASLTQQVADQKAAIDQQTQKIADLEKQLAEATAPTPTPQQ